MAIRTVYIDVVVPAVASFSDIKPDEVWIASWYWIQISCAWTGWCHKPKTTYYSLPLFHALTGCDTVSSFAGRGKNTGWEIWKMFPAVTDDFEKLLRMPSDISKESISLLEHFLCWCMTVPLTQVNDARKQLFAHKSRTLCNIPPMPAAFQQHIKRACLQANCWNHTLVRFLHQPSSSDWGWNRETSGWQPLG